MSQGASTLVCAGCGTAPERSEPYPFACRNAGDDDVDHVIVRVLDPGQVRFPAAGGRAEPFAAYRGLLHSYHRAINGGLADEDFCALAGRLDERIASVDGHGFRRTPLRRDERLSDVLGFRAPGGVWVKDETGNVAGSHKGRHLMGVLLHLLVAERIGSTDPARRPELAIASCGNAALAAAVLARAADWPLRVFVPSDAASGTVARLADLGADVSTCPRRPGQPGDPSCHRLRAELAGGAIPFTCQGNLNGLAIEGGETLGFELVAGLSAAGVALDHLVVQVGGGALATACINACTEAAALGAAAGVPQVHTVQTEGAHPLERAYELVRGTLPADPAAADIRAAVAAAARHRSDFMWPWESEPKSLAAGILDDETYDWRAVVEGMLRTGGRPVVVSEDQLGAAYRLGVQAGYPADATGTAGLAGLPELLESGAIAPEHTVAVLFTGIQRSGT